VIPRLLSLALALALTTACLDEPARLPTAPPRTVEPAPVEPKPAPLAVKAPEVTFAPCARNSRSPAATAPSPEDEAARKVLRFIVETYARDPGDPWAIGHGMLALGKDMTLIDDRPAVDWLFEEYAEWRVVGGESLVAFPKRRGNTRIEPHTDLVLKALMESGVATDRQVVVAGQQATVADLYRHSLHEAYVADDGKTSGYESLEDAPWALQALATVAPPDLTWVAQGGRPMTLGRMTDVLARDLHAQTAFMRDAMARGETVEKQRQGIFSYACGGQHTLQGVAYAVGRGFGSPDSRRIIEEEIGVLYWRMGVELGIYDKLIAENPDYQLILLEQRLKFLGHFLESAHKMAAMELYVPTDAQKAQLQEARKQLVVTLSVLEQGGALQSLPAMRTDPKTYQTYLDFVGDSAHALRGLDLATGQGTVCW
jgi:hypothetical protein